MEEGFKRITEEVPVEGGAKETEALFVEWRYLFLLEALTTSAVKNL